MSQLDAISLRSHPRFISDLRFAMYWLPSEQAHEFDRWLRLPIRNRTLLRTAAREHFARVTMIPLDGDVARVYESFDTLLEQLDGGGEDVDRLTLWFASQFEGHAGLGMRPEATGLWMDSLSNWSGRDIFGLMVELHDIDPRLATSYRDDVLAPHRLIDSETYHAHKAWKSVDREQLGEFDRLVAELYFDEVRGSPASFLYFFVERRLHREWWRTARTLLNRTQIDALTEEFVAHVTDTDIPEVIPWEHLIGIDEAFTIDRFPVFEEVAAEVRA